MITTKIKEIVELSIENMIQSYENIKYDVLAEPLLIIDAVMGLMPIINVLWSKALLRWARKQIGVIP